MRIRFCGDPRFRLVLVRSKFGKGLAWRVEKIQEDISDGSRHP